MQLYLYVNVHFRYVHTQSDLLDDNHLNSFEKLTVFSLVVVAVVFVKVVRDNGRHRYVHKQTMGVVYNAVCTQVCE